ncbi:hypothetical protein KTN05_15105, partial [Paracoccus sp. Z118]|uniref:hypothetical protein n=1 Tax=Paracoccus sp. Z118 TaxID=2851017 RepID=UPI001C2BEFF1
MNQLSNFTSRKIETVVDHLLKLVAIKVELPPSYHALACERKGQHLAHEVAVGLLLNQLDQHHSVVGHRHLRIGSRSRNPNLPEDRRWPPA